MISCRAYVEGEVLTFCGRAAIERPGARSLEPGARAGRRPVV
jgi:hypothetical protein